MSTLDVLDKLLERELQTPEDVLYDDFNKSTKIKFVFLRSREESSWYCDTTQIWGADVESEYIVDILTDDGKIDDIEFLSVPNKIDLSKINNVDILAYSTNVYNSNYISKLIDFWKPKVLFHLSDEKITHHRIPDLRNFSKVKLVYRQNGSAKINMNNLNIKYLPLGYHSWGKKYNRTNHLHLPIKNRKYIWCFSGTKKGKREKQLNEISNISPHFNELTKACESTEMFSNSKFAFSPKGNVNLECSRTYEAMYNGCIPICIGTESEINYYKQMFEIPIPAFCVTNTDDIIKIMTDTSEDELENVQAKCLTWLKDMSKCVRDNIINAVKNE